MTSTHTELIAEIERAIVGKTGVVELVLDAIAAGGHVLLDDVPGVAKTLLARSLAQATGLEFSRIQFTPDLMPSDVTGSSVWNPAERTVEFQPGPVFAQIVLADEINRAPAKTQAALLEAMAEGQVTVDGLTHRLPTPFIVIATQNPVEHEGTYPLPEAQLDRFMISASLGYPDADSEREIVRRRIDRGTAELVLNPIAGDGAALVAQLRQGAAAVRVHDAVVDYAVRLVDGTRNLAGLDLGASPRGSLALVAMAQSRAARLGRGYALPDDVKAVAVAVLAHRLVLGAEQWVEGVAASSNVERLLSSVEAPAPEDFVEEVR
ncbi:MAG: AAA family ATPase [Acidimicrobiales bacterium]